LGELVVDEDDLALERFEPRADLLVGGEHVERRFDHCGFVEFLHLITDDFAALVSADQRVVRAARHVGGLSRADETEYGCK